MGFKEELLDIAGLLKEASAEGTPQEKIRKIAQEVSQGKTASAEPVEKIALELVNDMVEQGVVKKANFQKILNDFVELGPEKLASLKALLASDVGSAVRESLGVVQTSHTKLSGMGSPAGNDSAADKFNDKWMMFT